MKAVTVACAAAAGLVAPAIAWCAVPWAALLVACGVLLGGGAWTSRREGAKIVMANAAAAFVALAAFEGYLGYLDRKGDGTTMQGTITEGFTHADDVLGYAPDKDRRVTARKLHGDTVLYDVTYSIGPDGLRVTPRPKGATRAGCIVFFGDSVTFGEGVNDDQAFPYLVAHGVDGEFAVYNFAFSGYGPHQMLAALQAGMVESKVACSPTHFVYLAILEHIARVAGLAPWDRHGPRFRRDEQGRVVRDANFDSPRKVFGHWTIPAPMVDALDAFRTWQRFFGRARNPDDADLALFNGVVAESARVARARYPGSAFHVILWDGRDDARIATIERRLGAGGIPVVMLTSAIPDFTANASRYILSPYDGHPNPLMHRRLAEYVRAKVAVRSSR